MIRVRLDLNIFAAQFLASLYERPDTYTLSQPIVELRRRGRVGDTRVQLVISAPMRDRQAEVLTRVGRRRPSPTE
jgi:hypothetical protein